MNIEFGSLFLSLEVDDLYFVSTACFVAYKYLCNEAFIK